MLANPAMAVVLLTIVMTFVIIFSFIWTYNKIKQGPETPEVADADADADEASERGRTGT
jgi:hypothetical protein